jgi:hypothetical protein
MVHLLDEPAHGAVRERAAREAARAFELVDQRPAESSRSSWSADAPATPATRRVRRMPVSAVSVLLRPDRTG